MNTFILYLFIAVIATILIIYFVKKVRQAKALEKVKEMLAKHEEKLFIEELKQIKNRNFLEKATNGKDERV